MTNGEGAREQLVGLPEVAERLGVHRATVNDMVAAGRIVAARHGSRWMVTRVELERFASTYVRPPNAPSRRDKTLPATAPRIVELLREFSSASAIELVPFLELNEGNVRKHLRLMEYQGLVARRDDGQWELAAA
jgi:excisionase family DNA binding protein